MSSQKTGFAQGSLKPAIYFERKDGYIILAPAEKGRDDLARMVYEKRYGPLGWEWREARNLTELDKLEKRLIAQEEREAAKMIEANSTVRDMVRKAVASALRQQMVASDTTPYEREFIATYLELREQKRDKYRDSLTHHNL